MRDLRMLAFHLREFARNGYFIQVMVTSTLGILFLQELSSRAIGAEDSDGGWIRAGAVGMWAVTTAAAGMIGYQRFQGTLVEIVRTPLNPIRVLLPVISAASVFGFAAFPLAAITASLLGENFGGVKVLPLLGSVIMYWFACFAVSLVVGATFVLSPNAMVYEGLLTVPLVIVSGVLGSPIHLPFVIQQVVNLLPTTIAAHTLLAAGGLASAPGPVTVTIGILVALVWVLASTWLYRRVIRRAVTVGSLEVI